MTQRTSEMTQRTSEERLAEECLSPRNALLFEGAPESTLDDYFESLSKKDIHPEDVTHAAQIRGNRVCMFFREEEPVKQLLKEGGLHVNNTFAPCQRFHEEPSKVILSNCLPFISNRKLAQTLSRVGSVMSPIADVPVSTQLDNFKHVKSFRKTVDILFPDLDSVPSKVMVEYCTKSVPIYICVEDLVCASCKCIGHCSASCPGREVALEEVRRPRVKSASGRTKRSASPITAFFCRHAGHLTWEPGFTSSIDISRGSVCGPLLDDDADSDDVADSPVVSGDSNAKAMARTDSRTFLTFPTATVMPEGQTRPSSADCAKRLRSRKHRLP